MTVGIPLDHEIFRKIAYKACFKCRATAVSNSNEFDPEVARQWQGIGFKRWIQFSRAKFKIKKNVTVKRSRVKTYTYTYKHIHFHNLWIEFSTAIARRWKRAVLLLCSTADPVKFNCRELNSSCWTKILMIYIKMLHHYRAKVELILSIEFSTVVVHLKQD